MQRTCVSALHLLVTKRHEAPFLEGKALREGASYLEPIRKTKLPDGVLAVGQGEDALLERFPDRLLRTLKVLQTFRVSEKSGSLPFECCWPVVLRRDCQIPLLSRWI